MVCAKCQKLQKTTLATPGVKRKADMYCSSPASSKSSDKDGKVSATLGQTGIGKSKLLSKSAKNPYAAYASNCATCKKRTEQGMKYCHRCAYKANACAMCGKAVAEDKSATKAPVAVVTGQRFSAK